MVRASSYHRWVVNHLTIAAEPVSHQHLNDVHLEASELEEEMSPLLSKKGNYFSTGVS